MGGRVREGGRVQGKERVCVWRVRGKEGEYVGVQGQEGECL